ncbi:MAG: ABC transporter ATP-binding protein [Gammaproteobacteria bacterium]|nr:ABC transporter ATP-binding protein [Gammaproteobacteria bacterium]
MPAITDTAPQLRSEVYTWGEVIQMITSHRRELFAANVVAVLGALAAVPVPLLIPLLVDEVLLEQPGTAVAWMNAAFPEPWHGPVLYISAVLVLTLLLRILTLVFNVWQTREFTLIAKDVIFRIRRTLLQRLERFSMAEYETLGSSTVASHLVTDLDAIDQFVSQTTSKFIVAVLSVLGTALVLMWMHWQLALFILLLNPFVIYLTTVFGRRVKKLKARENGAYQVFQESLAETLDAIQQIRASNRERHYVQRVIDAAGHIRDHSASFTWKSDAANRLSFMVFLFGFDIFRALSMFMVLFSDLTIGEMLAVYAYLWFMMTPVQEILAIQYAYLAAKAALGRINQLMDVGLEPHYRSELDPFAGKTTTSISVEHVCFRYGDGPRVLDDVNLHIRAGEKVALVGASGGGKTTLVQILLGLYVPESGRVCFDGVPVDRVGLDVVRDNVATVLQHPALFNDTVRNNLTLGRATDDAALWRALDVAQLADVVRGLPEGLDTLVGRNGIRLSGGQRQRLAVARMVLSDPKVVILDEATSALDTTTEQNLHDALRSFLQHRTTLIIAHRLSAVRQADRALVFDGGTIVEDGHHDDLIRSDGLYASLYRHAET